MLAFARQFQAPNQGVPDRAGIELRRGMGLVAEDLVGLVAPRDDVARQ